MSIPPAVPIGTTITILAQSVDGQHNISRVDTLLMATGGGTPALVVLTAPKNVPPDTGVVGSSIFLSISGRTQSKVKSLGWQVAGVFASPFRDSVVYGSPLKDSVAQDSAVSFVGASTGIAVITPYMYDSLGRLYVGPPVNVVVVATGGTGTIPVVDFGISKRIETTDTMHVTAKDLAGVRWLGYKITTMPPANTFVASESVLVAGAVTSAATTFNLKLPIAVFPTLVRVMAFATNANGRQDSARVPVGTTGFVRFDTVTVVAGLTKPLPNGGVVADGIYHPGTNRIYLSNIERNTLEVFDLSDSTFHAPIQVGSRPWGVAARPLNRAGVQTDTILVANSGGTLISKVCVASCVLPAAPHEVQPRYALPNIIVYSVTSKRDANGVLTEFRKAHDFSDRPQYLAATCTGAGPCGDVIVGYTTTPTAGQTVPFTNQGTIRYENLTKKASHFFFEQSIGVSESSTDTLEIDRFAAQGIGSDSILVPFLQGPFITGVDTSFFSVVVRVPLLGFRDTTFARNSGNFAMAVFGEGGRIGGSSDVPNARGMTYNVTTGMITSFTSKGHTYNTAQRAGVRAGLRRRHLGARRCLGLHREHVHQRLGRGDQLRRRHQRLPRGFHLPRGQPAAPPGAPPDQRRQRRPRLPPVERQRARRRRERPRTDDVHRVPTAAGGGVQHELLQPLPHDPHPRPGHRADQGGAAPLGRHHPGRRHQVRRRGHHDHSGPDGGLHLILIHASLRTPPGALQRRAGFVFTPGP